MKIFYLMIVMTVFALSSCGPVEVENGPRAQPVPDKLKRFDALTQVEKDYVERFNVTTKDIRDFPPKGKDIEKYFHVFKSVDKLEDAKIFFFGEEHTHALNRIWSAGVINRLIRSGDVVLFEGGKARTKVDSVAELLTTQIFAAREYEKLKSHKTYKPTAISKIRLKYLNLFYATKEFLALDQLNLDRSKGYFWDLIQGDDLHPDDSKRNESMVQTADSDLVDENARAFIIAGALHIPHYEFARIIYYEILSGRIANFTAAPGANLKQINDAFYNYFDGRPNRSKADTKSIFEFIKDKDFAILIPKNLTSAQDRSAYLPMNAR